MAIIKNSFEGGTDGVTIEVGNSGGDSGNSFDSVTTGFVFSDDTAAHGTLSAKIANAGTTYERLKWDITDSDLLVRVYFRIAAAVTGGAVARIAGAGNVILNFTASGRIQLYSGGDRGTTTNPISTNVWYRAEIYRTATSVRWALYEGDNTTAVYTSTQANGLSLGSANGVEIGKTDSDNQNAARYIDDVGVKTGVDAVWGAWPVENALPVVTPGADQTVGPSESVSLSFTATDEDGVIASRETEFDFPTTGAPAITGGTTSSPSFTTGSTRGRLYVVRHTATDDQGGKGSATTEVRVPLPGGDDVRTLPMAATESTGDWSVVGATTEGEALADDSDSTYVESDEVSAITQSYRVRLQPTQAKSSGTITRRLGTDTGTANANIRLYEGDSLREQWNQALTSTPTDYDFTLAPGTISGISDWGNLYLELRVTS